MLAFVLRLRVAIDINSVAIGRLAAGIVCSRFIAAINEVTPNPAAFCIVVQGSIITKAMSVTVVL